MAKSGGKLVDAQCKTPQPTATDKLLLINVITHMWQHLAHILLRSAESSHSRLNKRITTLK